MDLSFPFIFLLLHFLFNAISTRGDEVSWNETNNNNNNMKSGSSLINFDVEEPFKVEEQEVVLIPWSTSLQGVKNVSVLSQDEFVSVVSDHDEIYHTGFSSAEQYKFINYSSSLDPITVEGVINMTANFIGFNNIKVTLYGDQNQVLGESSVLVGVTLKAKELPEIFRISLTAVLVIIYVNMGANIDLSVIRKIVKQPIGPLIGVFCQYLCMPLISFGLGVLLFPSEPLFRLGLFASGSSPAGGLSNMFTHLLDGSLDLSIMMTFISTVLALGTVPLWLLTLGKVILSEANFVIPYTEVIIGILIMVIPSFIGIFIQLKCERLTRLMRFLLTPLSIFNILFILTFGVYSNLYLFSYMTWRAILAGFSQTILGLIIGYLMAMLCRRNKKERIAISVETAVQNNNIAFLLLKMSLGKPEGDLAVLIPGCVALFTPVPIFLLVIIKFLYNKLDPRKNKSSELEAISDLKQEKKSIESKNNKETIENIESKLSKEMYDEKKDLENKKKNKEMYETKNGIENPAFESTRL